MKTIAYIALLICCYGQAAEHKDFPAIPKCLFKASHRLGTIKDGIYSQGSAVSIDLSREGLKGSRYLLTAAHCVVVKGRPAKAILVEIASQRKWVEAKILAYDDDLDIALLLADEDMPETIKLSNGEEIDIGDFLVTIGSPRGEPLAASSGYLSSKGDQNPKTGRSKWYEGSLPITHGNSGGGVFDPNTKEIVGIATAIWEEDKGSTPNIAFFVGAKDINEFLVKHMDKIEKNSKRQD